MFCEVSPELAAERGLEHGGWATIVTARARDRGAGARHRADRAAHASTAGVVHQVGLPYHWGVARADDAATRRTTCSRSVLDPNVHIQESKAATCDIRPGRAVARERAMSRRRPVTETEAWPESYGAEAQPRMGFFTDTSVCIGCKACEVACKEWNLVPDDGMVWTGESYDNTARARREQLAPRRVRRADDAPSRRRRRRRRPAAVAHELRRVQALHGVGLPRTSARPARSSAPSSAPSSCRRTSATAAATACPRARSASSTGASCLPMTAAAGPTAGSGSARSATTGRARA